MVGICVAIEFSISVLKVQRAIIKVAMSFMTANRIPFIPTESPACLSQRQVYCKTGKIKKQERSRTSAHKGYQVPVGKMKNSELKEYVNSFPDDAPVSIICANPRKRKLYKLEEMEGGHGE